MSAGRREPFTGELERLELPGGVRLHLSPSDKFKTALIKVFVRTDLRPETATEVALLPYVLKHGTRQHRSLRAMNLALEELYGGSLAVDVLKLGEQQVLTARLELVGDQFLPPGEGVLRAGLALLRDLLLDPARDESGALPAAAVDQEREKLQRFLQGLIDDKASYAAEACLRSMCAGEPFAVFEYGDLAALPAITGVSLEARRQALLAESAIDVYVLGAVDPQAARELVGEAFSLPTRTGERVLRGTTPHPAPGPVRELREAFDVQQGKLCLGLRAPATVRDPGYYPLFVMNGLLGGFPHSKLFKNVREAAGLCYDASSSYERFKGLLFVTAGIAPENFARARDECLAQLDALRRVEISPDELEATRMSYFQALRALLDSPQALLNLDYGLRLAGRPSRPDEVIQDALAVTPEQVAEAARGVRLDTVYFLEPGQAPAEVAA